MQEQHPLSPEGRRRELASIAAAYGLEAAQRRHKPATPWDVVKRVAVGVYNDGFIHAGNLAYLSILALFPFFILAAAIAQLIGQSQDTERTIRSILTKMPPNVADALDGPIHEVLTARTGPLLWFGALVGLWTAASFIETIRDILRRAYGVKFSAPFWTYRLGSIGLILGAVLTLMIAFGVSVFMASAQHLVVERIPSSQGLATSLGFYRIAPMIALFVTFYFIFLALTPSRYRTLQCRKWPGALLVTAIWIATAEILPAILDMVGGYEITYGSLAGVMIALIFFFIVGLGVVTGAELNAALADYGTAALEGEHYEGPFADELQVDQPAPDEVVEGDMQEVSA